MNLQNQNLLSLINTVHGQITTTTTTEAQESIKAWLCLFSKWHLKTDMDDPTNVNKIHHVLCDILKQKSNCFAWNLLKILDADRLPHGIIGLIAANVNKEQLFPIMGVLLSKYQIENVKVNNNKLDHASSIRIEPHTFDMLLQIAEKRSYTLIQFVRVLLTTYHVRIHWDHNFRYSYTFVFLNIVFANILMVMFEPTTLYN